MKFLLTRERAKDLTKQLKSDGVGNGSDGKDAYEVAVSEGFSGTVSQWLNSLKGATGAKGAKGDKGDKGEDGADGSGGASLDDGRVLNHKLLEGSTNTGDSFIYVTTGIKSNLFITFEVMILVGGYWIKSDSRLESPSTSFNAKLVSPTGVTDNGNIEISNLPQSMQGKPYKIFVTYLTETPPL